MQTMMGFNIEPIDIDAEAEAKKDAEKQSVEVGDSTGVDAEEVSSASIYSYFDVSNPDNKESEQLKYIYNYFAEEATSKADLLWRIRSVENRIGTPELGTKRFEKVYRYLKLLGDRRELDKEISAHERKV